jgi:phosphoribosylformylglycinamidine synthase subunit PurQ / glutaminase
MRLAVIRFPGSNCDQDALCSLRDDVGVDAEYVWHQETSLRGFDGVFIPGGFSYGDYLRCGAMAARTAIMDEVIRVARQGLPVIGVCNGFQVLCETGLLPGALMANKSQKFVCDMVTLRAETDRSIWTRGVSRPIRIPVAHGEGRYVIDEDGLKSLEDHQQIAFRYCDSQGRVTEEVNFNGSVSSIAGILNSGGNVLGIMPHPERASRSILGSDDGLCILNGLKLVESRV